MIRAILRTRKLSSSMAEVGEQRFPFQLPKLPFESQDALAPVISKETIEYHYGKHHAAYVNNLNDLIKAQTGSSNFSSLTLKELIKTVPVGTPVFNNAAQIYNHAYYWCSLKPTVKGKSDTAPSTNSGSALSTDGLSSELQSALKREFQSVELFVQQFGALAGKHFGSGWVWLASDRDGKLKIVQTHDAECVIRDGLAPILVVDVWEHAYYVDYRNNRMSHLSRVVPGMLNWSFASSEYAKVLSKKSKI